MLHAVRYVKAAGGIGTMLDVEGGAQQDRFPAGTQQLALRMAERARRPGELSAPSGRIVRADDGTVPSTPTPAQRRARAVVVAIPPQHRAGIAFEPALPEEFTAVGRPLAAGQSQQGVRRLRHPVLAGRRPFGRGALRRRARLHHVRREPRRRRPGHSAGLHRCRAHSIRCSADAARAPGRWGASPHCSATPRATPSTTSTTVGAQRNSRPEVRPRRCRRARGPRYGPWLRKPVDDVFWAGTETADEWTGFLDGAVRSGQRAAAEVRGPPDAPS